MEWQEHRRETGLLEHVCEHGIGHPGHGSALWVAEQRPENGVPIEEVQSAWMCHGCDGCCSRDDFPGTWFRSMRAAHRIIRSQMEHIRSIPLEIRKQYRTENKNGSTD